MPPLSDSVYAAGPDFNVPRTGTTNSATAINNALAYINARGGGTLPLEDGGYLLNSPLVVYANTHLRLAKNAVLLRNFAGLGESSATIKNHLSGGLSNIFVTGGRIKAVDASKTGKHVCFVGVTRAGVEGMSFEGAYGDWNVAVRDCFNTRWADIFMDSGSDLFTDGLHFYGGNNHRISDCDITCGDDCLAFSNEDYGAASATTSLHNVVVTNCVLYSRLANIIRIHRTTGQQNIYNIKFSGITGRTGTGADASSAGIELQGTDAGHVYDISFSDVLLDCIDNALFGFSAANLANLSCSDVKVLTPYTRNFWLDGIAGGYFDKIHAITPRNTNQQAVLVGENTDCSDIYFSDSHIYGATSHGAQFGGTGTVTRWGWGGGSIRGCSNFGLYADRAVEGLVTGLRSSGNVWGILESANGTNNRYYTNNLLGNSAGTINMGGTGGAQANNG